MWKWCRQFRRDERGLSFIFAGIGFMAFVAASTLAIDVGMFMTARSQSQNAADAGALAGAIALGFNDWDDRSSSGPAVLSAINTATANKVMAASPSVEPGDVTFPLSPAGAANRVKVTVFRNDARENPIPTLIGPVFNMPFFSISATATAEASPGNAVTCVKPFTIPDRWVERTLPPWREDSTYERYDNKGRVLIPADEYPRPLHDGYNGYSKQDVGTYLTIRAGTGNNISPTMYFSWKMPNAIGGDFYRDNIANCNQAKFSRGYVMTQEPGNMVGPTVQGIDDLMAKDPTAYWDPVTKSVHSTKSPSPRVFPIPLYDPEEYAKGKANGRNATLIMSNWIGFFLEGRSGNNVYGRITTVLGVVDPNAPESPADSLAVAIRLVE